MSSPLNSRRISRLGLTLNVNQEISTVEADTPQNLQDGRDEAHVEDGPSEFNVAKVTRTLIEPTATCLANRPSIIRTHPWVSKAMGKGLTVSVGEGEPDLDDGRLANLIRTQHTELYLL
jgi:hypothetical protein